ncbi:MinD/ParA family ATP-binding protein [Frankia sp. AgKG'84/4]
MDARYSPPSSGQPSWRVDGPSTGGPAGAARDTGPGWSVDGVPQREQPAAEHPRDPIGAPRPNQWAYPVPDRPAQPPAPASPRTSALRGFPAPDGSVPTHRPAAPTALSAGSAEWHPQDVPPAAGAARPPRPSDTWPSIRQPELPPAPPVAPNPGSGNGRVLPIETRTFDPLLDQYPLRPHPGFGQAYPPLPGAPEPTRAWSADSLAGPVPATPAGPAPARAQPAVMPSPATDHFAPPHLPPPPAEAPPPAAPPSPHGWQAEPAAGPRAVDPGSIAPMPTPSTGSSWSASQSGSYGDHRPSTEYPAPPPPPGSVTGAMDLANPPSGPVRPVGRIPSWLRDPAPPPAGREHGRAPGASAPGADGTRPARHRRVVPHTMLDALRPGSPAAPNTAWYPAPDHPPAPPRPAADGPVRPGGWQGGEVPGSSLADDSRRGPAVAPGRHRGGPLPRPALEPRPDRPEPPAAGRAGQTRGRRPGHAPWPGGPAPGYSPYPDDRPAADDHGEYRQPPAGLYRQDDDLVEPTARYGLAEPGSYAPGAGDTGSRPPAPGRDQRDPRAGLLTSALLPPPPQTSSRGWRKLVYQVSAGAVNPGPSPDEVRDQRLVARIRTPLLDCHRIAVMSLKGGVGKTTTTVAIGSTLASLRGDRVVAIDANPDRGTLGSKVPRTSAHTVRELLEDAPRLHRYVDVRKYLSQADSRLEVLASANDPELSDSFGDAEYRAVDDLLQRHYSILLTDCGTGIRRSAMHGVLETADTLVIVSSATEDGGSSARATLDWLDAHGYADLVRESVAVISMFPAQVERAEVDTLAGHFEARTRRVVRVPYDPHLADGGRIVLSDLRRETRDAYREIAGAVGERFGQERGDQPR